MSEIFTQRVAAEIRAEMHRQSPPMTQDALAALIRMSQPTLSRRLAGEAAFNTDELVRVCRALRTQVITVLQQAAERSGTDEDVAEPAGLTAAGSTA